MLNLAEYRHRSDRLSDHLPWAALVGPGIILNKDGSFQRSFAYRGPDLESSTEGELVGVSARINNVLRRFGSGWALFLEAARTEALGYPDSDFPDSASALVDKEREANFAGERDHFETHYHLTLVWMPPADAEANTRNAFVENGSRQEGRDWREAMATFVNETNRAYDLLAGILPEIRSLDDADTLTYLHSAVSDRRHPVNPPQTPVYLDALLADTPLSGGLEPVLGSAHLRTITLLGFPALTSPGLLDALNHQDLTYRWCTRFIALDKSEATAALTRLRRQWFNKRKSLTALLREVMYNQPAQLLDSDADNKVADADEALQALGGDHVAFGYLTVTITISAESSDAADERIRLVERIVNGLGFTTIRERVNAVEAWLSSIPGHLYANVRQPLIHSLNLAHIMPLSCVWAGPAGNDHLGGPPLLLADTAGSTPFRLSSHMDDVGHMLIVGPTGAGKSVLLAVMAMQFRRYRKSRIFLFDKGWSSRAAVLAMGGTHHPLCAGGQKALAFQPLASIHEASERTWAAEWLVGLFAEQGVEITPEVREALWSGLLSLASAPPAERTLTGMSLMLQSNALRSALQPYTLEGPLGELLDASADTLSIGHVQCFETEALMNHKAAVFPVLTYLFHRLEQQFDGRPTLMVLDEAWVFLDHPLFAARLREWLKVLRKKNVAVIFATQSLADVTNSSIAPAIIESCPQRIFLPNARASEPQSREAYERFGLNDRQIELIGRATPKRDYYLQSRRGNRLFELKLGPIARAFCGAGDPASQKLIDELLSEQEPRRFAARFLERRNLSWAATLIDDHPSSKGA